METNKNQTKRQIQPTRLGLIDRAINFLNPSWGQKRMLERIKLNASIEYLTTNGYITPGSKKRTMRGWAPSANGPNEDFLPKSYSIRAGCRDLQTNTSIAPAIVDRISMNTNGVGLRLSSQIDAEYLGLSKEAAKTWNNNTEREWKLFTESIFSDAELTLNFHENALLAFVNFLISGDCFIILPSISYENQVYDLKVKVVEADLVSNPKYALNTYRLANGVESNKYGAPIAYHFKKIDNTQPIDIGYNYVESWERIPRFNNLSFQQVLHIYKKLRPGQKRGVPLLAHVIEDVKQLTRYKGAEVDAAVLTAMFTVFVKSVNNIAGNQLKDGYVPPDLADGPNIPLPGYSVKDSTDERDDRVYEMGRANVIEMDENQDISVADPKHPISGFGSFLEASAKEIGSSVGVPYGMLMLNFQSSFSASKAELQEFWKTVRHYRYFSKNKIYKPVYAMWMAEAVIKGRIDAPGFFDDVSRREAWLKSDFIGPGQGMIDPLKESKAMETRIKNKITNREREFNNLYEGDWYGEMDGMAKENEHLESLNLNASEVNANMNITNLENTEEPAQ